MSWLKYLEGISNRELNDFQDKIYENEDIYPENFKRSVDRILDIHLQFHIQDENYIDDVTDLPNVEWYRIRSIGWSKNALFDLQSLTNKEWFIEMIDNLLFCIDND